MNTTSVQTSLFERIIGYVLCAFFLVFPFLNSQLFLYGGTSARSVGLIGFASLLAFIIVGWSLRKTGALVLPRSILLLPFGLYLVFIFLSAFLGINFEMSFWSTAARTSGLWYLLNLGIFMYAIWFALRDKVNENRIIVSVIVSAVLYSLLSLMSPEGLGWMFEGRVADGFTFGNSTFAGMYVFGAFMLSVYFAFRSAWSWKKRWVLWLLPVFIAINPNIINSRVWNGDFSAGFAGEARASAYVLVASLAVLLLCWFVSKIKDVRIRERIVFAGVGVAAVAAVIFSISLLSHDGWLRRAYLSQATLARPLVWEMSEKAIAERPVFGWGIDNFEKVFERYYDNRLLQEKYGNEAWFDRAHNVFIDQTVDNGFVGSVLYILMYLALIGALVFVALRSSSRNDRIFAVIVGVYAVSHFVELQTAFDTTVSYPILALMFVFGISLFDRTRNAQKGISSEFSLFGGAKYVVAAVVVLAVGASAVFGWFPFLSAQMANGYIRNVGSPSERIVVYDQLLSSPVDQAAFLWRTTTDFQRAIGANPQVLNNQNMFIGLQKELSIFEQKYRDYIADHPQDFRARLNLADMLIYQRLFGIDKLKEAQSVLDEAIVLVTQSPQPYWMKAVAYIYMKKFPEARAAAQKGLDLNPEVEESQNIVKYVERSTKTFPDIELYFFRQI